MNWISRFALALLAWCGLALGETGSAAAAPFYGGKTITVLVGFSPGGGFDTNARLLARFIGAAIPGHPSVVVQNMPGADTVVSLRYLASSAPKDGTVIATFERGLIGESRVDPARAPFDFRKFGWIGSVSNDFVACYVRSNTGLKNVDDLKGSKPLNFGIAGVGSNSDLYTRILTKILHANIRAVNGYPGSSDVILGMQRGELDGNCGSWDSIPESLIRSKFIRVLFGSSQQTPPDFPKDAPYLMDLVHNQEDKEVVRALTADREVGRPFIASSDVPLQRLAILRRAFDDTMKNGDFLAAAARARIPVRPLDAAQALKVVDSIYAIPESVLGKAKRIDSGQ